MQEHPGTANLPSWEPRFQALGLVACHPQAFLGGILQPQVVMPGRLATLCRVEAVDDGEPLEDRDVMGIGWLF